MDWVDSLKGLALAWVFINHLCERVLEFPIIGNPTTYWPPLVDRIRQLAPVRGHGFWDVPLNLFRYVGLTGDQGVGLFLFAGGFGLAWSLFHRGMGGGWLEFGRRRVLRLYPMWLVLHGAILAGGLVGMFTLNSGFLLSVIGLRVTVSTFYAYIPAWWFFTLLIQLYVVFPLLWTGLNRWGPFRLMALSAAGCFAARALGLAYFDTSLDIWLRGSVFITRLPEFVLGMVVARALFVDPKVESRLRGAGSLLAALGIYVLGTALALTWWGNAVSPLLLVAGAVGLLYPILARASSKNVLGWFGRRSLSIFLIHHPIVVALVPMNPEVVTAGVVGRMAAAVVVTIIAGLALERAMDIVPKILGASRRRWGTRGLALRAGLVLAAGYAAMIPLELAVRRAEPIELYGWGERPSLQPDDRFGWRLLPDRTTRLRWGGYDYVVSANSLGFPGREVAPARTPGSCRILVTGDAFTSAEGVDTVQAWPRLVERRLAELRKDRPVEVLNFAVTGYGPNQYAAVVEHFAPIYRPDLILVEMYVNEFDDVQTPDNDFRTMIGFGRPPADGVRAVVTLRHLHHWIRTHVAGPIAQKARGRPDAYQLFLRGVFSVKVEGAGGNPGVPLVEERLARIKKAADAIGARLELVLVPAAVQVCGPERPECFPRYVDLRDPREYDLELPQRRFREIADRLKVGTVDLRDSLRRSSRCPHPPTNMHWTVQGHELVAEQVAGHLAGLPELSR